MPWKTALSLFLSTLRLKLLEDSSLDPAPEVDPGKDSGAADGKGEGVPFSSLSESCPSWPSTLPMPSCFQCW